MIHDGSGRRRNGQENIGEKPRKRNEGQKRMTEKKEGCRAEEKK